VRAGRRDCICTADGPGKEEVNGGEWGRALAADESGWLVRPSAADEVWWRW
jgi:hypothetical protein